VSLAMLSTGFTRSMTTRVCIGYSSCMGLMMGCVMSYVNSAQQIFETEVYGLGSWFPLAFGSIAAVMGVASFVNSSVVGRIGMRRMAHGATIGFILVALIQFIVAWSYGGAPPLLAFGATLAGCHFLFSLIMPNSNAMAMEPVGDIAGTASSFMGFYTTLAGALLGYVVGQHFNGTVIPLTIGYLSFGCGTLLIMLWAERGRLFQPHNMPMTR